MYKVYINININITNIKIKFIILNWLIPLIVDVILSLLCTTSMSSDKDVNVDDKSFEETKYYKDAQTRIWFLELQKGGQCGEIQMLNNSIRQRRRDHWLISLLENYLDYNTCTICADYCDPPLRSHVDDINPHRHLKGSCLYNHFEYITYGVCIYHNSKLVAQDPRDIELFNEWYRLLIPTEFALSDGRIVKNDFYEERGTLQVSGISTNGKIGISPGLHLIIKRNKYYSEVKINAYLPLYCIIKNKNKEEEIIYIKRQAKLV